MENQHREKEEIARRYAVFCLGLFLMSCGVSLVTLAMVGTSPISSIPYVLSLNTPFSMGFMILMLNLVLIIGQMLMLGKEGIRSCKWELFLQIPFSILFGVFVDATMVLFSTFYSPENYMETLLGVVGGCALMAAGVSLEVIADVSMVSGEYFVSIASKKMKRNFGIVKIGFDVSLVLTAVACSLLFTGKIDGVREGTLIVAILTGPLVKLFLPRLRFIERWEAPHVENA